MTGIYIHIPFCKKACHYCNFHFSTSLLHKNEVISAIQKEIYHKSIDNNESNYAQNVHKATLNALDNFKGKECKIGRARMFAEKSKDLNDPGMYAISKLSSVFVE